MRTRQQLQQNLHPMNNKDKATVATKSEISTVAANSVPNKGKATVPTKSASSKQ